MALTFSIDNDRSAGATGVQDVALDQSAGTQTQATADKGNDVHLIETGGNIDGFGATVGLDAGFETFLTTLSLTGAQKDFAAGGAGTADVDGASSSSTFIQLTATNQEKISDLFFTVLDDPVTHNQVVGMQTLAGENLYLHVAAGGNFATLTTASGAGGRVVAAFGLYAETIAADLHSASAGVQMITFEAIKHPINPNPDDTLPITDVLQIAASASISFNFDNLPSGSFLYAAVGNSSAALLVTGQDLNVNDSNKLGDIDTGGKDGDPSDTVNTSQGGIGATIGVNSQHFADSSVPGGKADGPVGVFTLVKDFQSFDSTTNGTSQGTGINVNEIDYGNYVNAPSAKIFISQSTGGAASGGGLRVSLWEAGGGDGGLADHTPGQLKPEEKYADVAGGTQSYIGDQATDSHLTDDWAVALGTVTVKRGNNEYSWTLATSGTTQGGNIKVTFDAAHPNTFTVIGLTTSDTIGFVAKDDPANGSDGTFNRFDIQSLANTNPVDIGRIDLDQGVQVGAGLGSHLFIDDDGPTLSGLTTTQAVGEDFLSPGNGDLSTGNPDSGDAKTDKVSYSYADIAGIVNVGTDAPALTSLVSSFVANTPVKDINGNNITSKGEGVFWAISGSVVQGVTATNRVVFTITNDSAHSEYDVDLQDQIDHHDSLGAPLGDEGITTLNLTPAFAITDKDLDPATLTGNLVKLDVENDVPIQNNNLVSNTVDEDGVREGASDNGPGDGIAGGVGDVAGELVTVTGSIAALFTVGADEPVTYGLSATTSGLPSLTSGGVAVAYSVTGNVLTAYLSTGSASNAADQVFTFSITNTSTGAYSFTLIDQLDHASLDGQLGDNTENDLLVQLGSILQATDKDGDTITYAPAGDNSNGLVITVDDDTPTQNSSLVSNTVDEDGVREGASDNGPGDGIAGGVGDVAGELVTVTGSISALFNSGADEPVTYGLSATTSGLPSLTSGGVAVAYSVTGNVLTAYLSTGSASNAADQVFTFSITNTSTGAYSFTLIDQLDHASLDGLAGDNTENDLLIQLGSILQATDKDGDTITYAPAGDNSNGLVITVDDDTPTAKANVTVTHEVQEDALTGGNTPDSGDPEVKSVTATITNADLNSLVNSGADENMSFALNTAASGTTGAIIGTNVVTTGDVAVKSGGVNVTWAAGAGGSLSGITTVGGVVTTIFTLAPSSGNFVFTLADQVDHSGAENDQELLGIDLTKAFLGADFDHDAVTLNDDSIVMNVENDLPIFSSQIASKTLDWVKDNSVSSSLNGRVGGDDPATYRIDKFTDLSGFSENLSSDGKTLTYVKDGTSTTFYTLQLSDTANAGAGGYTFTVNQPPPPQSLEFNFDNLASGNFLWVAVGGQTPGGPVSSTGLLVTGSHLNLNPDGTGVSGGKLASDQVNTSQGGAGATIGIDNQMFTPGDSAIFTFVNNYVPLQGVSQVTGQDIDLVQYTGYANVNSGSLFISQKQGNTKLDLTMSIFEAGTGPNGTNAQVDEEGSTYASGGNISGTGTKAVLNKSLTFLDDFKPDLKSVEIKDGNNVTVGTWTTDAAAANASNSDNIFLSGFKIASGTYSGVQVTISANNADINGVDAFYSMKLTAATGETFNRIELAADTGKFDIGKFVLDQGQDTPDVDLAFSVSIEDKDADLNHFNGTNDVFDDFKIKVDGTGVNNDPNNVAPTGFSTSYDSPVAPIAPVMEPLALKTATSSSTLTMASMSVQPSISPFDSVIHHQADYLLV